MGLYKDVGAHMCMYVYIYIHIFVDGSLGGYDWVIGCVRTYRVRDVQKHIRISRDV